MMDIAKDVERCPYCQETDGRHACNCWDPTYHVVPAAVRTYPELLAEKDKEIERLRRFRDIENPILSDEVRRLRKEGERKDEALILARSCINEGGTVEAVAWCLKQIDASLERKEGV